MSGETPELSPEARLAMVSENLDKAAHELSTLVEELRRQMLPQERAEASLPPERGTSG